MDFNFTASQISRTAGDSYWNCYISHVHTNQRISNINACMSLNVFHCHRMFQSMVRCHWIDEEEMLDLVAIAQSCPGAIAVNGAIVVGYKLAGLTGVLCSVIATVIPPFVILSAISFCYAAFRSNLIVGWMLNGMQSGVGAVIMEVSWGMASGIVKEKQYLSIIIMVAAFIANYFYKVSAIVLILICIALGVVLTLYREKKAQKNDRNTSQDNAQKGGTL